MPTLLALALCLAADTSLTLTPLVRLAGTPAARFTIEERMRTLQTPGVSIAVVERGHLAWARGHGVQHAGRPDPVTPTTLFQAGSISKVLAATAALRLVDQGKLSLDTDVNAALRSWKVPDNALTAREKVTLRRLLSHSAGLTVASFRGYAIGDPLPTLPQILDGKWPANTDPVRVDILPGSACRYSGGGSTIGQLLLTDVTAARFPALLRRLVFDPIGMAHSTFEQPPSAARRAAAHDSTGARTPDLLFPEMAAAGLWTTPTDLLTWAMEIAAARAGKSTKLLSQAMATEMLTVQKRPVGLGPFLAGSGAAFNFGHPGWNPGFHSKVVFYPATGQGAAVMANGDGGGRPIIREILEALAAHYHWPGARPPPPVDPFAVDPATRDRLVGTYQGRKPHAVTVTAIVTTEGNKLLLDAPRLGIKTELVFTAPREVLAVDSADRFSVISDKAGQVTALVFGDMTMGRLPNGPN